MSVTSRERLQKTLNHKDPGKVVVDLGSTPITGIHASALIKLRKELELEQRTVKMNEPLQLLGKVEEDVRQALDIDVVGITDNMTMFGFLNKDWKPWVMPAGEDVLVPGNFNTTVDEEGNTYLYPQGDTSVKPAAKLPKDGYYFDNLTRISEEFDPDHADATDDFADDFAVYSDEQLRYLEEACDHYYNHTEYGLIGGGALAGLGDFALIPGPSVKHPKGIRELTEFMMASYTMPNYIHELFDMQLEIGIEKAKLLYEAVGNKIQVMQISGTDFGMQTGPYIAPEAYREFYKPYHKKINDWVHNNTEWKTFFHCCGSIVKFLPDFHEAGIDVLNPVQTSAADMEPGMLKNEWGDKFVFWGGGIDTQKTLPFGTPDEVYEEAQQMLRIFAPGGGYVFNTIHNIQPQTPIENLVAMFQAVRDYNKTNKK